MAQGERMRNEYLRLIPQYTHFNISQAVGFYEVFPGMRWGTREKPSLWHRFWVKVFFGWTWVAT